MRNRNWITPELYAEIVASYPENGDISLSGSNTRNHESFAVAAEKLFPAGRIFASMKQLDQVADKFCSKWAVKKLTPVNI